MTGIYKITNKVDGKIYIGQTIDLESRLKEHKQKRFVPIDMIINVLGVDNFDFEVLEECSKEELDEKEIKYIKKYNSRENGYNKQEGGANNSIGEGNGRAKLTEQDVIKIRTAYNNHTAPKLVYEDYKEKVSFNQFQAVWQGRSWSHIMPEVFTEENKRYYVTGQFQERASIELNDLLKYRKMYVNKTRKEVYKQYLEDINEGVALKETTFYKILIGDVKDNSLYKQVPLYKKSKKRWELNNKPVSTIPGSWE